MHRRRAHLLAGLCVASGCQAVSSRSTHESANGTQPQGFLLGQEWVTGKKLQLNRRVADQQIEAAQRELDVIRLRTLTDVRIGFYDVLIAQRRRELATRLEKISRKGAEAARWAIDRAHAEVVPNIEIEAIFQDDRGTGSRNGNLQGTLPLPLWNRNQGGINQAEANAVVAEKAVDRLALNVQARFATVFQRYESARNQVDQYSREGGLLESAGRTLELIQAGYQAEEFSVLDLLNAQRTYFQTYLAYPDSLRELWVSVMEIRGLLLRGSLPE